MVGLDPAIHLLINKMDPRVALRLPEDDKNKEFL